MNMNFSMCKDSLSVDIDQKVVRNKNRFSVGFAWELGGCSIAFLISIIRGGGTVLYCTCSRNVYGSSF